MIKYILILISLLSFTFTSNAQLVVNTGMTPTQYVQNVLVGAGVTVSNVTYSGDVSQLGDFNGANTNIGIGTGIIMATGDVNVAVGPNTDGGLSLPMGGINGPADPDLDLIINDPNIDGNDAVVLEFDFVPTGDTVKFNYIFGSEEYPEFAPPLNSGFNDAFGFFLSGPGIAGPFSNNAVNIATIPGTTTPVSINNVNPATNTGFYVDNGDGMTAPFNTGAQYIQFDGYTTVLQAIYPVTCGLNYHIKLAICDAADGSWDSGVFLQAGSFSSNTVTLASNVGITAGDSILYEGCGTAFLDFVRDNTADTSVYHFNITGTSSSSDYSLSADSVLFLPGVDTVTINFNAIQDGLTEPLETVIIELIQTICSVVDTSTITFYIADYPAITTTTHDTLKNCNVTDSLPIWVNVIGPPHNILWNTGATTDTIWVNPLTTTTYYVSVTDTCGANPAVTDSATLTVIIPSPIVLTTSDDSTQYCPQDSIWVYASASGGGGGFTYNWNPGGTSDSIYVNPNTTTTYYIDVVDICGGTAQDSVTITIPNYIPLSNIITTNDTTLCAGLNVDLDATITGGVGSYFSWDNGLGNVIPVTVTPNDTTTFVLTAQDSCGAIVKDSVTVLSLISNIKVTVPDYNPACLNEILTLIATVTDTVGITSYLWNTGETTPTIVVNPINTTTYSVTVNDQCKSATDNSTVTIPLFADVDIALDTNLIQIDCPRDLVNLSATITGGNSATQLLTWFDGTNTYIGNNISVYPQITTIYKALVLDTCAMDADSIELTVNVPIFAPLYLETTDDTTICRGEVYKIGAIAAGGSGGYSYDWHGLGTTDSITVQPYNISTYNVTVIDDCNNYANGDITIDVKYPQANFTYEYLSDYTVAFTDSSYIDIVYQKWLFEMNDSSNAIDPVYTYNLAGNHEVLLIVRDIEGCYDTILKEITPPMHIYAPNTFTPNSDNRNDIFYFKGMGIEEFEVLIFDRWGELVYESSDINEGWDGSFKGLPLPTGAYIYKVHAKAYNTDPFDKLGTITIIK